MGKITPKPRRSRSDVDATLTMHGIAEMTPSQRQRVEDWLLNQIVYMRANHTKFAGRVTCRLMARSRA